MAGTGAEAAALALVGPTASGKTALSLDVAEALGAEIVSMDSRQVYRGMDIGTAKPTSRERAQIPHHGLDLVDPSDSYSAGRFARDARRWISSIREAGRTPLLVGGTGFFLRALTDPLFREPDLDPDRVTALRAHLDDLSRETLESWVERLDPERAEVAKEGGPQRLGRTLEVTLLSGRPMSWWHEHAPLEAEGIEVLVVVLEPPREWLDERIDARVTDMARRGLVDEVRGLLERGIPADAPGLTAVGYREIVRHLEGEWTLDEALDRIRSATRRYARRQLTWFRNQMPEDGVIRLDPTEPSGRVVERIVLAWNEVSSRGQGSFA